MNFFVSSIAVLLFGSVVTAVPQSTEPSIVMCCPNEMCVDHEYSRFSINLIYCVVLPPECQAQALEFAILDVNATLTARLCAGRRTTQLVSTSAFAAIAVTFRHHSIYIFCEALGLCAIAVTWGYSRIRTIRLASPMRQTRLSMARSRAILLRRECWW